MGRRYRNVQGIVLRFLRQGSSTNEFFGQFHGFLGDFQQTHCSQDLESLLSGLRVAVAGFLENQLRNT